jgi:hypothetical protein
MIFLINNLMILLLHFNIKISEIIDNNITNYFCDGTAQHTQDEMEMLQRLWLPDTKRLSWRAESSYRLSDIYTCSLPSPHAPSLSPCHHITTRQACYLSAPSLLGKPATTRQTCHHPANLPARFRSVTIFI